MMKIKPNQICKYKNSCKYAFLNSELDMCWGCKKDRNWTFDCKLNELELQYVKNNKKSKKP